MDSAQIETLAKGLTDRDRHGLRLFRPNAQGKLWHFPALRDRGALRRRMEELGFCSSKGIATKLGLALRAHITKESHDAE